MSFNIQCLNETTTKIVVKKQKFGNFDSVWFLAFKKMALDKITHYKKQR